MFEQFYGPSVLLFVLPSGGSEITEIIINLLIQIAVILFAAKIAGELASRYLKLPPELAEMGVGVLIGPYALGAINIPGFGPLFPIPLVDGVAAQTRQPCLGLRRGAIDLATHLAGQHQRRVVAARTPLRLDLTLPAL